MSNGIEHNDEDRIVADLTGFYGDGGGVPTAGQWRELLAGPAGGPICVVNLVRLREQASAIEGVPPRSGMEAFMAYGAGSIPRIHALGGNMVFFGRGTSAFIGDTDGGWDAVVVVTWPDRAAFLSLFMDQQYREAFQHRRAGVARYKAVVTAA